MSNILYTITSFDDSENEIVVCKINAEETPPQIMEEYTVSSFDEIPNLPESNKKELERLFYDMTEGNKYTFENLFSEVEEKVKS
jgi:hypothetical protein